MSKREVQKGELVKNFREFFIGNSQVYGLYLNKGWICKKEELTNEIVLRHLNQEITIGSYYAYKNHESNEWFCKYICVDIDKHENANNKEYIILPDKIKGEIDFLSMEIYFDIREKYEIEKNVICRNFSGRGFHIWIKLDDKTLLERAFDFKTNLEEFIKDKHDLETEIFPKQESLRENDYGNFVKLPLSINRKNGEFCYFSDDFKLSTQGKGYIIPDSIKRGKKVVKREGKKNQLIKKERKKKEDQYFYNQLKPCLQEIIKGKEAKGEYGNLMRIELTNSLHKLNAPIETRINAFKKQFDFDYKKSKYFVDQCQKGVDRKDRNHETYLIQGCEQISKVGYCLYENMDFCPENLEKTLKDNSKRENLYQLYNEQTRISATYPRNEKRFETKAFQKWLNKLRGDISEETLKRQIEICVHEIIEEFDVLTLDDSEQILVKKGNAFINDTIKLRRELNKKIEELETGTYKLIKANILENLKDKTRIERSEFYTDPFCINFQNGLYDFKSETFYPKEQIDYKFFYQISYDFKEGDFDCPKFKKALRGWLSEPFKINDIFEMIGLSLTLNTSFKKSPICYGPPDTGKTQFISILGKLFDKFNRSSTSLQRLTKDQFGLDNLQFKVINIKDDLPSKSLFNTGIFKDLTGGGTIIQGEIKGGKKFEFTNYAKFWFCANIIPEVPNYQDKAFFNRFILIPFGNEVEKTDSHFKLSFYKTITEDQNEMQGIIHESIKGFKRLIERNRFRDEIQEDTTHIWIYNSDPVYRFISDYCERDTKERIEWNEFKERFNTKTLLGLTPQKLKSHLDRLNIIKRKGSKENIKKDFVYGLKWKNGEEQEENNREELQEKEERTKKGMDQYLKDLETESKQRDRGDYSDPDRF